jgi:hypothetical protein
LTVVTAIEGGFTEVQKVRVNVERGYIEGGLFRLGYDSIYRDPYNGDDATFTVNVNNLTTGCLPYGSEASQVQASLQAMDVLTSHIMPFKISVQDSGKTLVSTSSIFGILTVGSVISLSATNEPSPYHLFITQIVNARTVIISENVPSYPVGTTDLFVFIVESNSVQVSRQGTGNSTAMVLVVTETSDSYVPTSSNGYYRLKMTYEDKEIVSKTCLKYDAQASDFQSVVNSLGFDFNGDGIYSIADYDHVSVTRSGDGSVISGYGYAYTLTFGGPKLVFAHSNVMGFSDPTLEIMDEGHYGGCNELNSTISASLVQVNYGNNVGKKTWFSSVSTLGYIQPGDRLRLPASSAPYKLYLVEGATANTISVDTPLTAFAGPPAKDFNLTVVVVRGSLPEYSVHTAIQGEDSYSYDVYFTGPHITNAEQITPIDCDATEYKQFGGMLSSVSVETIQEGGSQQVQTLTFSATSVITNTQVGGYWKLVMEGSHIMGSSNGNFGYTWGVPPIFIQNDVDAALISGLTQFYPGILSQSPFGMGTTVTVEGFGSIQETPKYVYTIVFNANIPTVKEPSLGYGYYPPFSALGDGEVIIYIYVYMYMYMYLYTCI